jgi:hypothetical protein
MGYLLLIAAKRFTPRLPGQDNERPGWMKERKPERT